MFKKAILFGLCLTISHFGMAIVIGFNWEKAAMSSFLQVSALGAFVFLCKGKFVEVKEENSEA